MKLLARRRLVKTTAAMALGLALASVARSASPASVRFLVVDPVTGSPVKGLVTVEVGGKKTTLDSAHALSLSTFSAVSPGGARLIKLPLGKTLIFDQAQVPLKEITIKVTATRLIPNRAPAGSAGVQRGRSEINKFVNTAGGDTKSLTKGQKGVAEDSAGQQHVRGEHAEIAYVIDGIPLPDRLSGGQGAVVVPSTIDSLEMLTGGFAPEFGGNTAAVLNINTLPGAKQMRTDSTVQGGNYQTLNGEVTSVGPLGRKGSFVFDLNSNRTALGLEPQQPDFQDAHDAGSARNYFAKLRMSPTPKDALSLTLSNNPNSLQIGNRTGLPSSFALAGEGFGFLGMRNADGTRPDATNPTLLGAQPMVLPSQQQAGMDIDQHEVDEFASLSWQRRPTVNTSALLALTVLHSGQDLDNRNPAVDVTNLPVDSSIEYNPTVSRNVHHVQLNGNYVLRKAAHTLKGGFLLDAQSGAESYQVIPASRLALDELAAVAPGLAPAGTTSGALDVNGNPVFTPTSGVSPVLNVQRKGTYKALYVQDTWQATRKLTVNYGLRADWFNQNQNLGQASVSSFLLEPRVNFSYQSDRKTTVRASYNKLFNVPPIAQGAIVGAPIQPETLSQYDLGIDRRVGRNQVASAAYYYKDIRNQVDTALMIPGSQIGLYSAVNFAKGAVHGVELSYDVSASKGLDLYTNFSLSSAKPNGTDNTGANVPDFNDHDQRTTVGAGLAYTWAGGATAAATYQHGSGLASSPVPPSDQRIPRSETDLRLSTGDKLFHGRGGIGLDVLNLFDERKVINFQSGFSGTRFMMARRIVLSAFFHF